MTVLILTGEEDVTADMVVVHLNASSIPVVRLDPADLTAGATLSGEYAHGTFDAQLSCGGRLVSLSGLRSVWVRRPGVPASRAAQPSSWLTEEAAQALYGMLGGSGARWMNHPDAARRARVKPWQLRLAQRSGLPVPATLITTVPQAAREFAARFPDLVVKPVSGAHPQEPPRAVPTTRVAPDADFDAVAYGPTLLQRRVDKRADIRLTAVGGTLLAARKEIPADADPDEVDVRFASSRTPWRAAEVPPGTEAAVRAYLRTAELAYGAFDFAEDSEGTWWFLECNQSGQFGFIEVETGQPIARTIAAWLARPGAPVAGS
ncbi:ATP-grasp ribosomal peptide maturase [Streptomyces sp. NPDC004042]|uniref:ATP-grasp ribosomal peptide maturase n=1 Tax=Streptomyces sp. NPDC004042 TaxID=3154451 RepID=UPI0033BB9AF0